MRKALFLFAFVIYSSFFNAQDYNLINYGVKDGLPSMMVYDVIEDKFGYLWFSTDQGLSRFNGLEFENFNEKEDGLIDHEIFDFYDTKDSGIWCTTYTSGLFRINGLQPKFTPYPFNRLIQEHTEGNAPYAIHFDSLGSMKMTFQGSLEYLEISKNGKLINSPIQWYGEVKPSYKQMVLKQDSVIPFFYIGNWNDSLRNNYDSSVFQYKEPWTRLEAVHLKKMATSIFINFNEFCIKKGRNTPICIQEEDIIIASDKWDDEHFWLGYREAGASIYSIEGKKIDTYLEKKSVSQLYKDREGNTWITTLSNGVFFKKKSWIKDITLKNEENMRVYDLEVNDKKELFIADYNGTVSKLVHNNFVEVYKSINHSSLNLSFSKEKILSQLNDLFPLKEIANSNIYAANPYFLAVEDTVFIGHFSLRAYENGQYVSNLFTKIKITTAIKYKNRMYAGSISGLYYHSKGEDISMANLDSRFQTKVRALCQFQNKLLIGTSGEGLLIMDENQIIKKQIGKKEGLNSDYISSLFIENDSVVWLATNKGLNRLIFSKDNQVKIIGVSESEGLLSNQIEDIIIIRDTVWVGTNQGLNYFTKPDFQQHMLEIQDCKLHLVNLLVNGEKEKWAPNFKSYEANLSFTYQAINFRNAEDIRYRYYLKGLDSSWQYTNERTVNFIDLETGNYQLIIQAKLNNQQWENNQIKLDFSIQQSFWKTSWFILLSIVLLGIFFYFLILKKTRNRMGEYLLALLRHSLTKLKKDKYAITVNHQGKQHKIKTSNIGFIKASGNYIEIHTSSKVYLCRMKIGDFLKLVNDPLEFIQLHRSYIIRLDKIEQKGKKEIVVLGENLPVARNNLKKLESIII